MTKMLEPSSSAVTAPTIRTANPLLIGQHPLVADLPKWADNAPELRALAEDIAERGLDYPLLVVAGANDGEATHLVVDGRHRLMAAQMIGLKEVPVEVVPEDRAAGIILNTLFQRRHYTKSGQALLIYEMFPGLRARMGKRGAPKGNRNAAKTNVIGITIVSEDGESEEMTTEDYAARLDIPREYFSQIRAVNLATRTPEEWDMVKGWLLGTWRGPDGERRAVSCPNLMKAYKGWQATHDPHEAGADQAPPLKPPVNLLDGFRRSFKFIANQAARWDELSADARHELRQMWHELRKSLPKELQP